MTTAPELPLADATAMTRFHRIFREALDATPRYVGAAPADDEKRADVVRSYYANVLKLLHAHHEAEDPTIYPLMVQRLPEHAEENATMEANMPPPVHDFWVTSGRGQFRDFVAELRG